VVLADRYRVDMQEVVWHSRVKQKKSKVELGNSSVSKQPAPFDTEHERERRR
jgi:hypothetical protein